MIVRYFASEWCMTSLFQKGKIYGMWRFSLSFTVSSCTTKPLSSQFWLDNAEENVAYLVLVQWWGDDRQVSQSGKPLCTGASLWAVPKLARGLRPASVGAKRTSTGCLAPLWNPLTARSPLAKLYMTAQR